jgi:ABC-type branched-subunit amino acid transport system ATPase component
MLTVSADQTSSEFAPNELPGLPPGSEAVIALRGVAKWYGDVVAVSDLTFGIGAGVTALLGPNGAGKSTILNLVSGLIRPSSGTVQVLDRTVPGDTTVFRELGLAGEQEQLYGSLTGREFVRINAILQNTSVGIRRGCGSGSRWQPRSFTTRECCCSMSRSMAPTRCSEPA